jgi:MoxR-like ATPase
MIARCFLDARYFQVLMGMFTLPEELVGPFDIEGFRQGRYNRIVAGYMPDAHIVFLDEAFKANPSLLNTLLTLCNERRFDNGAPHGRIDVPLRVTIAASNEIPEGSDMDPLWDRFMVRHWIRPLRADEDKARALLALHYPVRTEDRRRSRGVGLADADRITLDELDQAQAEVSALELSDAAANALVNIARLIDESDATLLTDRTWTRWPNLARACAWLSGSPTVEPEHLLPLSDTCWREPSQAGIVVDAVYKYAAPAAEKLSSRVKAAMDVFKEIPHDDLNSGDDIRIVAGLKGTAHKVRELNLIEKEIEGIVGSNVRHAATLEQVRNLRKAAQAIHTKAKAALAGEDSI